MRNGTGCSAPYFPGHPDQRGAENKSCRRVGDKSEELKRLRVGRGADISIDNQGGILEADHQLAWEAGQA